MLGEDTDWRSLNHIGSTLDDFLKEAVFNLYAEYIMRNAGIKIAGRNISRLRYAGDTTLMAESEEELK